MTIGSFSGATASPFSAIPLGWFSTRTVSVLDADHRPVLRCDHRPVLRRGRLPFSTPTVGPFPIARTAYDRYMDNADSQPVPDAPDDLAATEHEGPANPSSEAEDRPKSPEGGRSFDDDEVAVDPEGAMTANGFIGLITVTLLALVVVVVAAFVTGSTILGVVAFIGLLTGIGLVLKNLFEMMSTD